MLIFYKISYKISFGREIYEFILFSSLVHKYLKDTYESVSSLNNFGLEALASIIY